MGTNNYSKLKRSNENECNINFYLVYAVWWCTT